jgi:hypothetical protein
MLLAPVNAAGYSGTALHRKLGIHEGSRVLVVDPPAGYPDALGLPTGVELLRRATKELDVVLLFVVRRVELARRFPRLARALAPAGGLWVAWPKKSSGVATDLDFAEVQRIGLESGLVDNKVAAIDETWSGLRFVIRLKDRPPKR